MDVSILSADPEIKVCVTSVTRVCDTMKNAAPKLRMCLSTGCSGNTAILTRAFFFLLCLFFGRRSQIMVFNNCFVSSSTYHMYVSAIGSIS